MSEKPKNKGGRPRVDSEAVNVRLPRDLLEALDGYIMDLSLGTTRQVALRQAFRAWAEMQGDLPMPPGRHTVEVDDER